MSSRIFTRIAAAALAAVLAGAGTVAAATGDAAADSTMVLEGAQEGTVFRSLTIEGENRIRIDFERPELLVELDPASAPGLTWGSSRDVLDRTVPDLVTPFLASSATVRSPYTPRPWLSVYTSGPVANFATDLEGVESWTLQVVDSRGAAVVQFAGKGNPPREIPWSGLDTDGEPVPPGLTYSFIFESYDKAGNKRRFTGDGFELPAYRLECKAGPCFMVSGQQWRESALEAKTRPSALVLEAASRFNLAVGAGTALEIRATGRSFAAAEALGNGVADALAPLLPGGRNRIVVTTVVEEGAPPAGTLVIKAREG